MALRAVPQLLGHPGPQARIQRAAVAGAGGVAAARRADAGVVVVSDVGDDVAGAGGPGPVALSVPFEGGDHVAVCDGDLAVAEGDG